MREVFTFMFSGVFPILRSTTNSIKSGRQIVVRSGTLSALCLSLVAGSALKAQSLVVTPSRVTFNAVADSVTSPPTQTVQITASDGSQVPFTLNVPPLYQRFAPGQNPFTFSFSSQTTPATVTIGFLPYAAVIDNSTYHWPIGVGQTMVAASSSFPAAPEVDLFVMAELTMPPPPVATAVVNAASQLPGASPGGLISVEGNYIGPGEGRSSNSCIQPNSAGPPCYYTTEVGGTTVTLNGVPAPVVLVGPSFATVIVPYTMTGQTVDVVLTHYGQTAPTVTVPLAITSPGIFANSLTNDDHTQNAAAAPEPAGSDLSFAVTGFGVWNQPGLSPNAFTFPGLLPAAPVSVSIGGQPAQIKTQAPTPQSVGELTLTVTIPPGLADGPQPIVFTAGNNNSSQQPVNAYVGSATPSVIAVSNAASFIGIPQAPGTLVSVFGRFRESAVPTVSFDGHPAPILYSGLYQINTVIPFEVAGQATTTAVVSANGLTSPPFLVNLTDTSPGIFHGGVLNQDGSINGPNNPAAAGTIVQIFATGAGVFSPALADGSIVPIGPPYPTPLARVSATIDGLPAQIEYAGAAPNLIAGVLQVNVVVPAGASLGQLILTVGQNNDLAGVYIQ
jgi:uncharacterized protein (TIGR03437 family)